MKESLFFPIIDNGMGLSRTSWGASMFALGLSNALSGRQCHLRLISCSDPASAMNFATDNFLETGADRMIVIDTDEQFTADDIKLLLSHEVPLVSGLVPKKTMKMEWPVIFLDGEDESRLDSNPFSGLVEVAAVGKGFISIHRSVFETLAPHVPEVPASTKSGKLKLFWRAIPGGMSEDYCFCYQYRDLGGRVFIDPRICVKHEGFISYPIPV